MKYPLLVVSLFSLLGAVACSSDLEEGDHVWKEQTDAIDKAKAVEKSIQEAFERNKKQMDK